MPHTQGLSCLEMISFARVHSLLSRGRRVNRRLHLSDRAILSQGCLNKATEARRLINRILRKEEDVCNVYIRRIDPVDSR
jgi:hypothetical protein